MSSIPAPYSPPSGSHRGTWIKGGLALLLLIGLAWVSIIAVQYFVTGKPIAQIPAMPRPVAKVLTEAPRFEREVGGVAAPIGVAIGPDGSFYVTESEGERLVRAFDASGKPIGTLVTPDTNAGGHVPAYVAVSPSGEIFVSDRSTNAIYRFSRTGESLGTVPGPADWHPLGLAFDAAGTLYVTDVTPDNHRVLVLDQQFQVKAELLAGKLNYPNSLAVDDKGRIWVSDSNNGRVIAVNQSGAVVGSIARGDATGDLGMPRGIAVDSVRQWLFVVDTIGQDLKIYDISGTSPKFLYSLGSEANPPAGGFAFPNGAAFDGKGKLIVTDRANNRALAWRY